MHSAYQCMMRVLALCSSGCADMGVVRHGGGVPICKLGIGRLERRERLVERLPLVQVLAGACRSPRATRGRADRCLARLALQDADQPALSMLH